MVSSNLVEIPFRKSIKVDLAGAIKQYINTKYDQHPDQFAEDLRLVDGLRNDAINVQEPHSTGARRLTLYAAQLRYMGGKFPIDIGVDFPWYSALGYHKDKPTLQNNVRFELANVLFNLAALYSQLSFSSNRTTSDGLKIAAQYGIAAAGTLFFLRTEIIPDMRSAPPEDMDDMTLQSLEHASLAQAQECFWQKAVKDGMKDGTIARLAAKVSDYYSEAADFAVKSDAISAEWIHHFQAKHHHFAAAAQFRQSRDCLEKRKYGEQVARLQDSVVCVNEALKESRWINRVVLGDLEGLKQKVTEELKRAERDNDMIYLLPVPSKSELKVLDRANMVSSKVPQEVAEGISMLGPGKPFGPPLFEKLVPYAVHHAASIYASRLTNLINSSIIPDLEAMTAKLRDVLISLNLPGSLTALEKPLGLPPGLVSKAEELRQQDALYRLKRSVEDTTKLKTNDLAIYQEGVALLEAERSEDDRARQKYGTDRWSRPASEVALAKLYEQSKDLQGYLNSAGSSDTLVQSKIRENEATLRVLTGSTRDLEKYVPSSRQVSMSPKVEHAATQLRAILNEVSRLETRRKRKIEALRAKAKDDDISPALLAEAARLEREYPMQKIEAAQFENLFDSRLDAYEADRESLVTEQEEQDQLIARIREANTNFNNAKRGDALSGTLKERERALQELENAYTKYKEIVSNLETGRKFYNGLAGHVGRFRESCVNQVNARRVEMGQLESEITGSLEGVITTGVGGLRIDGQAKNQGTRRSTRQQSNIGGATAANSINNHHHNNSYMPVSNLPQQNQEPLTAPVPTRAPGAPNPAANMMNVASPVSVPDNPGVVGGGGGGGGGPGHGTLGIWSPERGIRFGAPPGQGQGGR